MPEDGRWDLTRRLKVQYYITSQANRDDSIQIF